MNSKQLLFWEKIRSFELNDITSSLTIIVFLIVIHFLSCNSKRYEEINSKEFLDYAININPCYSDNSCLKLVEPSNEVKCFLKKTKIDEFYKKGICLIFLKLNNIQKEKYNQTYDLNSKLLFQKNSLYKAYRELVGDCSAEYSTAADILCYIEKNKYLLKDSILDMEYKRAITNSKNSKIVYDSLSKKKKSLLEKEIRVSSIKSQIDAVTTTFLPRKHTLIFQDKKRNNFYRNYNLIKKDEKGIPRLRVGFLTIYDSINPYIYEKDTDEFVEIFLKDKGVKLYEGKIEIGMKLSSLVKEFGEDFTKINNTLIYKSSTKVAVFEINDSLVSKIRIGIYKDGITIDEVLNKKW